MLTQVKVGASVTLTPKEADGCAGDGDVRLVTCPNGRIVAGIGQVGLVEHTSETNLNELMRLVKAKRDELAKLAAEQQPTNVRENLYTFTKI